MRVVEVYKASGVEARCICQILETSGIKCHIVGEDLESALGIATAWNMASILVSEEEEQRAREVLAERLGERSKVPRPKWAFQYGMRALLVNFTLIAIILGCYRPLGPFWPDFAWAAFQFLVIGNVLAFAYFRKKRRCIEDGDAGIGDR